MPIAGTAALLAILLAPQTPQPDNAPAAPHAATAVRAEHPPTIDGRDDDPVWRNAPRYAEFRTFEPTVDKDPRFATEFRAAYDAKNLYVFVRMFDPHPDSIMRALTRRDNRGPSDQIKVIVDSYHDRRSGYQFAVNPDGVKRDYSISNDNNEDGSWDGIWDVATRVDSAGWTAEYRIPLSQLRYGGGEANTFGFGIWRDIERYKERVAWPLWNPKVAGLASQLGTLIGLEGLSTARRIEATPYIVSKNVQRQKFPGAYSRDQQFSVGGDVKIGLTPNITLDATVNPDFGQVEADPSVVNLTAFETFFSERRPFFVEGTGLYRFALNCYIVVDCGTNEGLFYSRRIGRSPTLRGMYGDEATPSATTIAAAAKLTGRTAGGLSFGALEAYTPRVVGTAAGPGLDHRTVEPASNFAVLRANQDLRGGEAGLSVIGTAVNRSLDEWTSPFMANGAYAAGVTFRNRFSQRRYELAGQLTGSRLAGSREAIWRTQRNSVHYYQQPDDDLTVDSSRTSLSGYAAQLKFGKYSGGITRFETSVVRQSAGFDVNDLGYLRRADLTNWSTWAALSFREARGIYRWAQVNGNHWEEWTTSGLRTANALNFNGHMGLRSNWDVHLGGTYDGLTPTYCDRCTRGGPVLREDAGFYPWGGINTDSRKPVYGGIWTNLQFYDGGRSHGRSFSPYVNVRPSTQLQVGLGTNLSRNTNNTQWLGNFSDAGAATHYAFARLDQKVTSMSVRVNYTATPNLTFELYAAPFTANIQYSDVRELSATPRAASYDDRFTAYTPPAGTQMAYKVTELRGNAVVRWEYRPGSTLFVVWQQGRADFTDRELGQSWLRDYRDLFDLHPNNTFLVKFAYWLNR
jgi:hypothetical protein